MRCRSTNFSSEPTFCFSKEPTAAERGEAWGERGGDGATATAAAAASPRPQTAADAADVDNASAADDEDTGGECLPTVELNPML